MITRTRTLDDMASGKTGPCSPAAHVLREPATQRPRAPGARPGNLESPKDQRQSVRSRISRGNTDTDT